MKKKLFNLVIAIVAIIGLNRGIFSQDNIPASTNPPGGLNPQQVPMLVAFGWDDNAMEDAMLWITDFMRDKVNPSQNGNPLTFDGLLARHTFFNVGEYWLDTAWSIAFNDGQAYCQWLIGDFDARYSGNRCPMLINAHTDNFSPEKFPQQAEDRQGGVVDFIDYVLTKPDVRMVRYIDVIEWMRNPVELGATWIDENQAMNGATLSAKLSIYAVNRNSMQLTLPESGFYSVSIYAPNGQLIKTIKAEYFNAGMTFISWNRSAMANGIYLVRLQGLRGSAVKKISTSNLGL